MPGPTMITGVSGVSGKVRLPGRTHRGTWTDPTAGGRRREEALRTRAPVQDRLWCTEENGGPGPGLYPPPLQKAGLTSPRIQRRQPGGAEAPAGLFEARPVMHHSDENLQPRGVSLGMGWWVLCSTGRLPANRPQTPPTPPGRSQTWGRCRGSAPPPLATPASLKPVPGSARQALTSREEAMEKARGRIGGMRSSR